MQEKICNGPGCTNPLPPHKRGQGHREREYCSDLCRQRAWRLRRSARLSTRGLLDMMEDQARIAAGEHIKTQYRDSKLYLHMLKQLSDQEQSINTLHSLLAAKDAEILRLQMLLEERSQKRKRRRETQDAGQTEKDEWRHI